MSHQEVEGVGHVGRGRLERGARVDPVLVVPERLRVGWEPERLAAAVAEVEVAEETVGLDRARPDQLDGDSLRVHLAEPGEPARKELHLGPPVGDEHDAWRFLCVELAQDELVGFPRR